MITANAKIVDLWEKKLNQTRVARGLLSGILDSM